MKKLLLPLFCAASMVLVGCTSKVYKSEDSKKGLEKKGYSVHVLSETEAKVLISGVKFDGFSVKSVVNAEKGSGDDCDIFLGFYFDSMNEAEKFSTENIAVMSGYADISIGKNLTSKVGSHNNVAYVGSETSFKAAF